ncbi:hypothetical protein OH76DRAFT_1220714 [Lentinus brumalis]|uniref:F-box domain-containing protein n=1 Tax=Lentinus brumalis TaxID=2498619 RepID=A0A371DLL9_9APHY|nr:hypothetical protein OH76DRAFT_1220714 [Polyporus brumalis]
MPETSQPEPGVGDTPVPPTQSARKALQIAEIFRTICMFASHDVLASLARCCKAFQEAALRELWSDLFDLRPLIRCLPEYAIVADEHTIQFSHTLRTEDWETFIKYASYVRSLGFSGPGIPPTVTSEAFQAICARRPQLVLLPNLRRLVYYSLAMPDVCLPYLLSIVGTDLRVFELDYPKPEGEAAAASGATSSALALLSNHTRLQEFKMRGQRPPTISPALSSFLCSMSSLTELHAESVPITQEALTHIAALPSLKSVYFCLPDSIQWTAQSSETPYFANVVSFGVSATVRSYRSFARMMPLPHVPEFTLALTAVPIGEPISTLFSYIRRQFDPKILKALEIKPANPRTALEQLQQAVTSGVVARPDDFRPIYEFTALERLSITPPWNFALTNDFARDMAKAWSRMQDLRLAYTHWCYRSAEPLALQVDGLAYFAVHCPDLHTLAIPFDAASWSAGADALKLLDGTAAIPERFYAPLEGGRSTSKLERLWVNILPIAIPAQVALYLSRLFPGMKGLWFDWESKINPPNEDYEEYEDRWWEVQRIFPVIIAARDDGRRLERETVVAEVSPATDASTDSDH